jgi:hypothetical protein
VIAIVAVVRNSVVASSCPTGLTELENAEYLKLEPLFHEEDRDHDRLSELSWKEFYAKIGARGCES